MSSAGFPLDEAPLRQLILKAYHEHRRRTGPPRRLLDAIRQFLSGAPGGESLVDRYWFEEDPPASARSFAVDLEKVAPGLAEAVWEPLLRASQAMEKRGDGELAPNVPVYVSSLSGPVALRAGVDEGLAAATLAAAVIGLSRVGARPFGFAPEVGQGPTA